MACKFGFFTAVLASILGTALSEMEFELFAYGKVARPGLRLCYADGLAYIGGFPSSSEEMANITLSMAEDSDRFVARASSAGSDDPSWFSERTMFVDLTEGATSAVGFVADSERLPTGATTVGFGLYGGWAFHKQANASLEMKFVAAPTNETGIYLVKWNAGATKASNDAAISLRTQAPVALDDKAGRSVVDGRR